MQARPLKQLVLLLAHGYSAIMAAACSSVEPREPTNLQADVGMPAETVRRSADFVPTSWSNEFIQSLDSDVPETHTRRLQELITKIKCMLCEVREPIYLLDLVDTLQKLGVSYHFKESIDGILDLMFNQMIDLQKNSDLYHASTLFRVLRDHGYQVPQDIFKKFLNEENHFDYHKCYNAKEVLSLYEASFLSHEGEHFLDEAREFATKYLKNLQENTNISVIKEKIRHALEIPFHRRVRRLEAQFFIEAYANEKNMNPLLLELAQLDYNVVQAMHRDEMKRISRWWDKMGLMKTLQFPRDRIVESWIWAIGITSYEPQFSYCRERMAQFIALITIIDDLYDVYGTMDEIELFTNAIERWDIHGLQELPQYMKIIFLAVFNFVNETSYEILRDRKIDISLHLRKQVLVICKAYYIEAKWYHSQYIPTYTEYMDNAAVSSVAPTLLGFLYLLSCEDVINVTIEKLDRIPNLVRQTGIIGRLLDDKAASKIELQRGDVHKSIECYMHHEKATYEAALDYITSVIEITWKKMNQEKYAKSLLPKSIVDGAFNFSRICHFYYQRGDAFSSPDSYMKEYISLLLIKVLHTSNC